MNDETQPPITNSQTTHERAIRHIAKVITGGEPILFMLGRSFESDDRLSGLNTSEECSLSTFKADPKSGWAHFSGNSANGTGEEGLWNSLLEVNRRCGLLTSIASASISHKYKFYSIFLHIDVELNGSLSWLQCATPCLDDIWPNTFSPEFDPDTKLVSNPMPVCPRCGGLARPNVIMLDDDGWVANRTNAQTDYLQKRIQDFPPSLVIELGARHDDDKLRALGENIARECFAPLFCVGLNSNELGPAGYRISIRPSEFLEKLNLQIAHLPDR